MKSIRHLVPLALLVTLAACGGDDDKNPANPGGNPGNGARGTLSFSHQGGGMAAGTFEASGSVPRVGTLGNWAGGARISDDDETIVLISAVTKTGPDWDMLTFEIDGQTTGTYSFGASCETDCVYTAMVFGVTSESDSGETVCTIGTGTMQVTSVSGDKARGTFSGTGNCISGGAVVDAPWVVSNGTFDVPLVDLN